MILKVDSYFLDESNNLFVVGVWCYKKSKRCLRVSQALNSMGHKVHVESSTFSQRVALKDINITFWFCQQAHGI